jgi:hypothetical protein
MTIEIKHRFTDAVLFSSKTAKTVREALIEAIAARANLAGANLAGAYLARADLADAYLAGANLAGAYLARAYLARAYLADAYLAGAYLAGANLAGAYLARAYLAGANLAGANLAGAIGIDKAMATVSEPRPEVPVIPNIHRTLLAAVTAEGCKLDMSQWHVCETAHCRAGWIVTLAGEKGKALEEKLGPARAASLIYKASDPTCRVPHWYAPNDRAMADIVACAEREAATSP